MDDQASTLRLIASNAPPIPVGMQFDQLMTAEPYTPSTRSTPLRCLAITGGKGGVGKSNLSVNLALELGELGKQIGLLDADFGLANADLLCGVTPKYHLGHLITGTKELSEITIKLSENVTLIPGGSGIEEMANFSFTARPFIYSQLMDMEANLDFMLIDTAAGIAENVIGVLISATEVVVVVTPDPTSIVDAYATIKVILRHSPTKQISVVVNNVVGIGDAEHVFQQISSAARTFLKHKVDFLGMVPHDPMVSEAIREMTPVVQYKPDSPASRAIRLIAKQIQKASPSPISDSGKLQSFWNLLAKS
jgi:flagellar biosynthesis protein FlhG